MSYNYNLWSPSANTTYDEEENGAPAATASSSSRIVQPTRNIHDMVATLERNVIEMNYTLKCLLMSIKDMADTMAQQEEAATANNKRKRDGDEIVVAPTASSSAYCEGHDTVDEKTEDWRCTRCYTSMGSMNPRQLCGKTMCLGGDECAICGLKLAPDDTLTGSQLFL